jgi:hypothetical protein
MKTADEIKAAEKNPGKESADGCLPVTGARPARGWAFLRRWYVPGATLALVAVAGTWMGHGARRFDPMTAMQDPHVHFQTAAPVAAGGDLTAAEAALAARVLAPWNESPARSSRTNLLFIANSQGNVVMDAKPGELLAVQWLQVMFARRHLSLDVHKVALGGMIMPEMFVTMVSAREQEQADGVLMGLLISEFSKLGVREEIASLAKTPAVRNRLQALMADNPDLPDACQVLAALLGGQLGGVAGVFDKSPAGGGTGHDLPPNVLERSFAPSLENRLQTWAERWVLFAQRDHLVARASTDFVQWRTRMMNSQSAAGVLSESAYRANLQMFELSLRYAGKRGLPMVVYLGPLRPGEGGPISRDARRRLQADVPPICARYHVRCLDYGSLLGEDMWTSYPYDALQTAAGLAGQQDYVHFVGKGHRVMADQLMADAGDEFAQWAQRKSAEATNP